MNFLLGLLAIVVGRIMIMGASIGDSLALAALCGCVGYLSFLETKKVINLNEDVLRELDSLKTIVQTLRIGRSLGK